MCVCVCVCSGVLEEAIRQKPKLPLGLSYGRDSSLTDDTVTADDTRGEEVLERGTEQNRTEVIRMPSKKINE